MIRNGDVEMQAREEEIRFMKMQLNEENRAIQLLSESLKNKDTMEQEKQIFEMQVNIIISRISITFKILSFKLSTVFSQGFQRI